jgi:hypothetical protein
MVAMGGLAKYSPFESPESSTLAWLSGFTVFCELPTDYQVACVALVTQ